MNAVAETVASAHLAAAAGYNLDLAALAKVIDSHRAAGVSCPVLDLTYSKMRAERDQHIRDACACRAVCEAA